MKKYKVEFEITTKNNEDIEEIRDHIRALLDLLQYESKGLTIEDAEKLAIEQFRKIMEERQKEIERLPQNPKRPYCSPWRTDPDDDWIDDGRYNQPYRINPNKTPPHTIGDPPDISTWRCDTSTIKIKELNSSNGTSD